MKPERQRLNGAITALITPFKHGEIDYAAFSDLVEWQIRQGINGVVPAGTTGEVPTLSWGEHIGIIRRCVEIAQGRVPVIAGTGTNDTQSTISYTCAAETLGADAALIVTPYYNRPSQEGLFRHFEAVAHKTRLPIIIYNVPGRTGVDLSLETLERLAALPNIVGIKDATGDLTRPPKLRAALGDQFVQLSGHDATAFDFNRLGGNGTISVVSNVEPQLVAHMHEALARGDDAAAKVVASRLQHLIEALERESNPVPIKFALHLARGICADVRMPLVPVASETADAIQEALLTLHRNETAIHPQRVKRMANG